MPGTGRTAARVLVIYTGGTFGMKPDLGSPGQPLRPMEVDELTGELETPAGVTVTLERFERLLDSSSMTPLDWMAIARRIAAQYETHDGFVVIHGTDTLAYTACALSFMFGNLAKPVVVTGSQLPLLHPQTDARLNYRHALKLAGRAAPGLPLVPEVTVMFGGRLLRGCRARKMSATARSGFDSPNSPWLGDASPDLTIRGDLLQPLPLAGQGFELDTRLEPGVLDITLHPALQPQHLQHMLTAPGIRGVLLRSYGSGNAPEDEDFARVLRQGLTAKLAVCITQCPHGSVDLGHYAASQALTAAGVISGFDMTPEAALTKLMTVLGRSGTAEEARSAMQENLRGELS